MHFVWTVEWDLLHFSTHSLDSSTTSLTLLNSKLSLGRVSLGGCAVRHRKSALLAFFFVISHYTTQLWPIDTNPSWNSLSCSHVSVTWPSLVHFDWYQSYLFLGGTTVQYSRDSTGVRGYFCVVLFNCVFFDGQDFLYSLLDRMAPPIVLNYWKIGRIPL